MSDGELGRIEDGMSDYSHGRADGLTQGYNDGKAALKVTMLNHERSQHANSCGCEPCGIYDTISRKALAAQRQEIW